MKNFGSPNKPTSHDDKRIRLTPFENFPADPVVGEIVYYQTASVSGLFIYTKDKTWDKIQTITSTVIGMGSEFPSKLTPSSLFYNNAADDEESNVQLNGFYYISDSGSPTKVLDVENHLDQSDPHPQYMQVSEVCSTFQPLKTTQSISTSMQTKMLIGEFSVVNAFKRPMAIRAGMYKVECVIWVDSPGTFLLKTNFGRNEVSQGLLIQTDNMISYTSFIMIEDDTNIVPSMLISHASGSANKSSSVNILPNSFISFDLMF